jgi:hypothetical protein
MSKAQTPLPPEVLAAFEKGKPIEAIRMLLSMRANGSLPAQAAAHHPAPPSAPSAPSPAAQAPVPAVARSGRLSPGEVPRSSSFFWGWVVVALLLYGAYRLVSG